MPRKTEQLTEYRRKRDFRKTAEPAGGDTAARDAAQLAFVIQKHAASHLHYDLRLELDGVMKSWAVPRGPSLDPAVKRLAMQVEDHPVEYNTFEGTIPKGEYGGGTVMLWDRGSYRPDEPRPGEDAEAAVRRGLKAGKLSITFEGERLRGSFALVRTDAGPKPKWLLIKHRDDEAAAGSDITAEIITSVATGRTMDEIAAESDRVWHSNRHDQQAGAAAPKAKAKAKAKKSKATKSQATKSQATKSKPAADGDDGAAVIAPMLPTPADALPTRGSWTYELWRGGQRVLAYVTPDAARLIDATGADVTGRNRQLSDELASLSSRVGGPFVADGELVSDDGDAAAAFVVSDLLLDSGDVLIDRPWQQRRDALAALLRRRRLDLITRQDLDDGGDRMLRRAARQGFPGILARRLDAPYSPGTRSDGFLRIASR